MIISCNDLKVLMSVSYITMICIDGFIKGLYVLSHKHALQKLCQGVEKNRPNFNKKQDQILDNYLNQWKWFLLYGSTILPVMQNATTFWSIFPIFNATGIDIPFLAWYPFDYKQPIVFQFSINLCQSSNFCGDNCIFKFKFKRRYINCKFNELSCW